MSQGEIKINNPISAVPSPSAMMYISVNIRYDGEYDMLWTTRQVVDFASGEMN